MKKAKEYRDRGKTVYSNVALNFPYKQLDYKEIVDCKLKDGIVILDEIHQLLPARGSGSNKISKKICDGFLSMVRKKGLVIYGTTQTSRKVDIRFREETDYYYVCQKYGHINKIWGSIPHDQNLNKDIPIMIRLDVQEIFSGKWLEISFIANKYFNMFDTKQIIQVKGLDDG